MFRLDNAGSQGEDPGGLQSLLDRLQQSEGTIAVLRGRVTFSAAAIALFCDKAYCLNGAEWGAIVKPEMEVDVLLAQDPDSAANRHLDSLREMFRARLEARRNRLRPDAERLALAMADPRVQLVALTVREGGLERARVLDQQELAGLREQGADVFAETLLTRPLMVTAHQAEEFGLSSGTLQGFDQLADVEVIDRATMGELRENWAEHMVAWLELLQPFLVIAGFLLLLLEVKTPGFALPGLLGCVFLGLAMFHSYLVGLAEITEILVFFLGLAAIAVEIFLLPGTVVFGLVGFLCLVLSLLLSQQSFVLPSNSVEEEILLWNLLNLVLLFVSVAVLTWL
ncbi:MAG TPA: hypothetical protein ENI87_02230, partial [bacterium]|nr:hypothetical protein [bacterium]